MGAENLNLEARRISNHSPAASQKSQAGVALVTGASSGIGEAVARKLVACGFIVIGCARREAKLQAIAKSLLLEDDQNYGTFYAYKCDLMDETQLHDMFKWIEQTFGTLNLLVNNAGTARFCSMIDAPAEAFDINFGLNCKAMARCAHYALKIMLKEEKATYQEDSPVKALTAAGGQIVFVNSIAAYMESARDKPFLNGYCAAKHALRVMVNGLRSELRAINSGIRIGEISPGFVDTEIFDRAFGPEMREQNACVRKMINGVLKQIQPLQPSDVANLVYTMVQAPPHVEINEIIVRPTKQLNNDFLLLRLND